MSRLRGGVLALVFGVLGLVLAGCHGTFRQVGSYWYLSSVECFDRTTGSTMFNAPYQGSTMNNTTGNFAADNNGCHPAGRPSGNIGVTGELYKQNVGICGPSYAWGTNILDSYTAYFDATIPYFCGSGTYYTVSHHFLWSGYISLQTYNGLGPGDSYSDGT